MTSILRKSLILFGWGLVILALARLISDLLSGFAGGADISIYSRGLRVMLPFCQSVCLGLLAIIMGTTPETARTNNV